MAEKLLKPVVSFIRGNKRDYDKAEHPGGILFDKDNQQIIVDGVIYGDGNAITGVKYIDAGAINFEHASGFVHVILIPNATSANPGFMSKVDKAEFDKIPETYATKEELASEVSHIYRFCGVVDTFIDLVSMGEKYLTKEAESEEAAVEAAEEDDVKDLRPGDVYKVNQRFITEGKTYAKGTQCVWTGEKFVPMEGEEPGYSKKEADYRFVPWAYDEKGIPIILLPKDSKLCGTMFKYDESGNVTEQLDGAALAMVGIYETGEGDERTKIQQTEFGTVKLHANLNSSDRPTVELAKTGEEDKNPKEEVAYLSDLYWVDIKPKEEE